MADNFFTRLFGGKPPEPKVQESQKPTIHDSYYEPEFEASVYGPNSGVGPSQGYVYARYDGEKRLGELGPVRVYEKDFYTLRARSKQMYIESSVCYTVINRFTEWVVGKGLNLKADPRETVLKRNKVGIDTEEYNNTVEELWKVYAASKCADLSGKQTLYGLTEEAHRECKKTGDMLVILRVINGLVKVQHVDGDHVGNPPGCTTRFTDNEVVGLQSPSGYDWVYPQTGNRIRYGVEINDEGEPVAYHVRVGVSLKYIRVEAKDNMGMLRAYMVYGDRPEIESTRGTPLVAIIMERASTLDRYLEATVSGAEVRANFALVFEHDINGSGDDPLLGTRLKTSLRQSAPGSATASGIPVDANMEKIASDVAVAQDKTVINLTPGAKAKTLDTKQDLHVQEFANIHVDLICAAVNIPPSVAMSKYDTSFSSSRMAGKDWEHTYMTDRTNFGAQYLKPIHDLQVYLWLLQNMVDAPALLKAIREKNTLIQEAYMYATFTGDMFPDIDPLKTANFLRTALGTQYDHIPIMTGETASEMLPNGNGFDAILKQAGRELELAKQAGMERIEEKPTTEEPGGNVENKTEKPNRKTKTTRKFYGNV